MSPTKSTRISALAVVLLLTSSTARIAAQTPGTATFRVTTVAKSGGYSPRHVLAIWITDSAGTFVKTMKKMAANREQYLYTWRLTPRSVVDAVTGATLSTHQTHTVTWDCTDVNGAVVPDGTYRVRVEFTSEHAQGPLTPATHIQFTKGPEEVSVTPADLQYFKSMSLTYRPDVETEVLVPAKSAWKFHDGGIDLHATEWKSAGFDDSTWEEGPGPLGYANGPTTTLDYGPDSSSKYPCYYFRRVFSLGYIPSSVSCRVLRDDGIVVYLNGHEIVRENMDAGPTTYAALANTTVDGSDETTYFQHTVDPADLVLGTNILAVEIHQASASSSDIGFDLALKAAPRTGAPVFRRGDVDSSGTLEITDCIHQLDYLFQAGPAPACLSAADANDDGSLDISDAVFELLYLFGGVPALPVPGADCGEDPTPDGLPCGADPGCA